MQTTGWLFDLYPLGDRMVLWFITASGQRLRLEDDFPYCLYLGGPQARLQPLARALGQKGWLRRAYPGRGRDLWTGREIPVVALEVKAYGFLPRVRQWLGTLPAEVAAYNCDLDIAAAYLYSRGFWPCAWYEVEAEDGRLLHLDPMEDAFAVEFSVPPLTTLTLSLTRDRLIPLGAGNGLAVGCDGRTLELEAPDAPGLVRELARWLKSADPDLVLSDWGDEVIIPTVWRWSREYGVPLPLDREANPAPRRFSGGRSYFSYGRIVYQGSSAPFAGRWHLDRRNSFYYRESGLMGLIQIARIGQMPLQQAARSSPGTLITSMQLARAVADGILIPWRKAEPEHFKTAGELLTIDKGGLTFMPPIGLHTQVAEVDFASMYPTIMAIHNISPETVNCSCCLGEGARAGRPLPPPPNPLPQPLRGQVGRASRSQAACPGSHQGREGRFGEGGPLIPRPSPQDPVPEAGYRLCRRREGLVPRTLRPILALREQLKARAKELPPEAAAPYKQRQTALKWMLVTCFGYLGYKNARFGKIEAHEAVTAYGRDKLLCAKETFEAAGFTVLHGLTDCLWVQKPGLDSRRGGPACPPSGGRTQGCAPTRGNSLSLTATQYGAELEDLCAKVFRITGVKLALEGVYRWIFFMAVQTGPEAAGGDALLRGFCRRLAEGAGAHVPAAGHAALRAPGPGGHADKNGRGGDARGTGGPEAGVEGDGRGLPPAPAGGRDQPPGFGHYPGAVPARGGLQSGHPHFSGGPAVGGRRHPYPAGGKGALRA